MRQLGLKPMKCLGYNPNFPLRDLKRDSHTKRKRTARSFLTPCARQGWHKERNHRGRECRLHTLIHTFPFETKLQYLGLNWENAEFFAPLFSSQHPVLRFLVGKVCIKGCNLHFHNGLVGVCVSHQFLHSPLKLVVFYHYFPILFPLLLFLVSSCMMPNS